MITFNHTVTSSKTKHKLNNSLTDVHKKSLNIKDTDIDF